MEMLDGEIVLFSNDCDCPGLKAGQPSFFLENERECAVFEEPTLFIHERYVRAGSSPSPNTWAAAAQALRTWFQYLQAIEKDWRDATAEDRCDYRDAYLEAISPRTGEQYSPNTIASRMKVTAEFYRYAALKGWYEGDLVSEESLVGRSNRPIEVDALANIRSSNLMHVRDFDTPKRIQNYKVAR